MLADDVIWVIDQAAPTPMIRSPRLDIRLAVQTRRKVACRKGEKIPSGEDLRKLFKLPNMFAILPPRRMLAGVARLRPCPGPAPPDRFLEVTAVKEMSAGFGDQ